MNRRSSLIIGLTFLTTAFSPLSAGARGRVRFRGGGLSRGAHHAGPVLSRDELRACVQREQALNRNSDELDAREALLKTRRSELDALESTIDQRRVTLDNYSKKDVDGYNSLVRKHRSLVIQYNDGLPSFNASVAEYQTQQSAFNAQCAGKAFYESDMQAVRSALK